MNIGMTSVTFRNKNISEIVNIAKKANLDTIEWGGDIHCPPDNPDKAVLAAQLTVEHGLKVSSYGSYFKLGVSNISEFESVCSSAKLLSAPVVRIWGFNKSPAETSRDEYDKCVSEAKILSDTAKKYSLTVCFEYHRNTLTQDSNSAQRLIYDIGKENMKLYWQPNPDISHEKNCSELKCVLPYVINIHCFHWINEENEKNARHLLSEGKKDWNNYISIASQSRKIQNMIIEFVKDDSDENFLNDAVFLKNLIKTSNI